MSQNEQDAWIEWAGGPCPLVRGTPHVARYRDGYEEAPSPRAVYPYSDEIWGHDPENPDFDIVAYRVEQSK